MIGMTKRTEFFEGGDCRTPGLKQAKTPEENLKEKFLGPASPTAARQPDGAGQRPEALNPRGAPSNFYRYAFTTYCWTMRWVLKKAPLMAMAPYMARIKACRSR